MSEHVNDDDLAPGQKRGEAHPDNPFSECKYPSFFRLFNRGDREKNPSYDIDVDFVAEKYEQFLQQMNAEQALESQEEEPLWQNYTTAVTSETHKELAPQKYDVYGEAIAHAFFTRLHSQYIGFEQEAAKRHGLKDLSEAEAEKLGDLSTQLLNALEQKDVEKFTQLYEEYYALRRQGVSKENFEGYEKEVDEFENNQSNEAKTTEFVIDSEIFKTIKGGDVRMGGWGDADYFPDNMKRSWVQNGLAVQAPTAVLNRLTSSTVLGPKVGNALALNIWKGFETAVKFKKYKVGAKVAIGVYCGMGFWTLIGKWNHINFREVQRQRLKTAYRLSESEVPLTPAQVTIAKKHLEWSKNFYSDDE